MPTGVAVSLTQDVTIRRWAERENNIVQWTEFDHGGHFAALEVPTFLIADVRKFFRKVLRPVAVPARARRTAFPRTLHAAT